ncbi:hypothetical protein BJV78DRAFT_1282427 [Lactifluus subvellereus]|nr:hypothetical protein BJV78DRAFT_1282427 [Lactifluus subvellereus]
MSVFGGAKGYSWKTNQFGLTIDNIDSRELIVPDGTVQTATPQGADLFWSGLRACDIFIPLLSMSGRLQQSSTKFILKAHLQGNVWVTATFSSAPTAYLAGEKGVISGEYFDQVGVAIAKYQQQMTHRKAAVLLHTTPSLEICE